MKKLPLFTVLFILASLPDLAAQDYSKLSKKELIIEIEKKSSLIDRLSQELKSLATQNKELTSQIDSIIEKNKISTETPEAYAKSLFNILKDNRRNDARGLLLSFEDYEVLEEKIKENIKVDANSKGISVSDWIEDYNFKCMNSFDKAVLEGINLGISWQNAIFIKTEFDIQPNNDQVVSFEVFFKSNDKDYKLGVREAFNLNGKLINWELRGIKDIEASKLEQERYKKEKEEAERQRKIENENKPYTPWNLTVGKAAWRYYQSDLSTFSEFTVKISNFTEYRVNRVKFQISIYTGGSYSNYKYFGKTYDKYVEVNPGDVITIDIPDLVDFYLGEDVSNQDNWRIECTVLEVYPKR